MTEQTQNSEKNYYWRWLVSLNPSGGLDFTEKDFDLMYAEHGVFFAHRTGGYKYFIPYNSIKYIIFVKEKGDGKEDEERNPCGKKSK